MQENTNRAIAYNSLVLYCTLFVTSICGIFNTRFSLQALGVDDFGLFAVLGSIISLIDIINTIMVGTTTRFMAVAIGKGDPAEINKQFNINRNIHVAIAAITLLIAFPIGDWYVHTHINYSGDIENAMMVFTISLLASVVTFIGVPYNGMMRAKENFITPSVVSVVSSVSKLIFVILLCHFFTHKLFLYALFTGILTAMPTVVYMYYCRRHFPSATKFCRVRGWNQYKDVFSFSVWSGYAAIASVFQSQGAGLIINAFFNTVMNAALGVANSICNLISHFAQNVYMPMLPQITKSYAANNIKRSEELVVMSTKYAFLLTLFISSPFLLAPDWIFTIWLGKVPDYAVSFMTLLIIDQLVSAFNRGFTTLIRASGKIALYEFTSNTLRLGSLVVAYFVMKAGAAPRLYLLLTLFSLQS